MNMQPVKQLLNKLVADTYALYIKTQKFHWNVEGRFFATLHDLFGDQYDGLSDAVDKIAERLRMLGSKAPGSLSEFSKLTTIEDSIDDLTDLEMIEQLVLDNESIAFSMQKLFDLATAANDPGTADLAAKRIRDHQKNSWMLRSMMK